MSEADSYLNFKIMETRDCIIEKISKVNTLLNLNHIMLQVQRRHLNYNKGLFFDRKECLDKIELREKIQDRLNNYLRDKVTSLITKI